MNPRAMPGSSGRRLVGVLVTFRRPVELSDSLARLADQDRRLDHLVVVDNDGSSAVAHQVEAFAQSGHDAVYVATPENLGPAGGIALGMRHALRRADDRDWIVLVDDDDPAERTDLLAELSDFGEAMLAAEPMTAGVGLVGARFDPTRGRLYRLSDDEIDGPVPIDYIGGNQFPFYLAGAVRTVGVFDSSLFFGFDDLEYGLRLRRAGYKLFASGPLWLEQRRGAGRLGLTVTPSRTVSGVGWRRYYSLRNLIEILRSDGQSGAAARVALVRGIGKPLVNLPREPRLAWRHLSLGLRACRDGWMGKMGRTIEPDGYEAESVSESAPR